MLRLVKSVIGLPIIARGAGRLGEIDDFVIDPAKGKIVAYVMRGRRRQRYLSTIDVVDYATDSVGVRDEHVLQELGDVVRIKDLLEHPVHLLGLRVVTDKGKRLGQVKNVLFDSEGHFLAKLYVRPGLLTRLTTEELIIPREQILSITPTQVTVRYDEKAAAPGAQAEIAS